MDLTTVAGRRELGSRIQSAIMGSGYDSLPEFARRLGWSRALIYQYVSGSVLVQLDRLQQIAVHTGKPLEWFLAAEPNAAARQAAELAAELERVKGEVHALREELAAERGARLAEQQQGRRSELALLGEYCKALRRAGDAPALVEVAARWLELATRVGDQGEQLRARLQMGHGWFLQGRLDRAQQVLFEAVQGAVALGDAPLEHSARQELVRALLQAGDVVQAKEEARRLSSSEMWWPRWSGRVMLASIAIQGAEWEEAAAQLALAEEVIQSGDESAARRALAATYVLSNRTTAALVAGNYRLAAQLNDELRSLAAQAGAADQLREAEFNRALVALRRGDLPATEEGLRRLEVWTQAAGDTRIALLTLILRSELYRRCGDVAEARAEALQALEQAAGLGQAHLLAEAELALAWACLVTGRLDDAGYHAERCAQVAGEHQLVRLALEARMLLAAVGPPAGAEPAAWTSVLQELQARGLVDLEAEAHCLRAAALPSDDAETWLRAALDRALSVDQFWVAHRALLGLAGLRLSAGDLTEARQKLDEAGRLRVERMGERECVALLSAENELRQRLRTVREVPCKAGGKRRTSN